MITQINQENNFLIAIEGPIGVGKTTLAKRLTETFQANLIAEKIEENPFLKRFYQNQKAGALSTQLFFLFQRSEQLQELLQNNHLQGNHIAYFLMDKDKLFAQVNLDKDELAIYEKVYNNLIINTPKPSLVIYLQAPVKVLLKRIKHKTSSID